MSGVANTANVLTRPLLLSLLTITAVLGCAAGPAAMTTRTFNVTGFTLPVQMVFSTGAGVAARVSGIAPNAGAASGFVMRNVMQAVFDVLEQKGRASGLPDPIIQIILGQLTVRINYEPLQCVEVEVNRASAEFGNPINGMFAAPYGQSANLEPEVRKYLDWRENITVAPGMMPKCIIFGNTVTAICNMACMLSTGNMVLPIPPQHLSISGTLTTTNPIMANWSREMWQSVVNRVVRSLASGPFGSNFFLAIATVS